MSLAEFVADVREREKTLTLFSDDETIVDELRDFFEVQSISVRRGRVEGAAAPLAACRWSAWRRRT